MLTLTGSNFKRVQALTLLAFFLITLTVYAYYEKKIRRAQNYLAWKLTTLVVFSLPTDFCDFLMYVAIVTIVIIITDTH